MQALKDTGFNASTLDANLGKENPDKKIVITFDDGSESAFKNSLDPLVRHRLGAIQFVIAGLIGKHNEWDVAKGETSDRMMDKAQIRKWIAAGNQIGSHTITHPNLNRTPLAQAREEIFASKKLLEDAFGVPVRHFSYPSGKWNAQVQDLVTQAGYTSACGVEFGVNSSESSRFALRLVVPLSKAEFRAKAFHRLKRRFVASRRTGHPRITGT